VLDSDERYSTLPEMEKRFRTPRDTWYRWRLVGQGPKAIRVGRKLLYPESEVQKWLASLEAEEARGSGRSG